MTYILILLTSMGIIAHSPVQDLTCTYVNKKIEIRFNQGQAFLKLPNDKTSSIWEMPESSDQWDPQNKQIFDTYNFKKGQLEIILKVPETKGVVTAPFLLFEDQTYSCIEYKKK